MVRPNQTAPAISRVTGRGAWWLPMALTLGLALITGFMGAAVHWSLQRPQDWGMRWSMEDESTEDKSIHQARLARGAWLGPGKIGGGVHLLGGKSMVVLDGWKAENTWTVELWVQALQPSAKLQLIAGTGLETGSYGVGLSNGMFAAMHYDTQGKRAWLSSGIKPSTNRWYHLAATYDGQFASIYVDGKLCATTRAGTRPPTEPNSGMHLGASHIFVENRLVTTDVFFGVLDHLSVYGRALSEAEVRALHRSSNINPILRQLACDAFFSLSFALIVAAAFGGIATRWHPKSAGVPTLRTLLRSYRAAIVVLLMGLTAAGCLYFATNRESAARDELRFHQLIVEFLERFDTRTESYVQHLTALRSWLNGENELTQEKWDLMMDSMRFAQDYHGLFSVGFAPTVPPERLPEFEAWARKNITTNYQVHWLSANSKRMPVAASGCSNCTNLPITFHTPLYQAGDYKVRGRIEWGRDLLDPNEPEFPEIKPSIYPMVLSSWKGQKASAGELEELYPQEPDNGPFRGTRIFLGVYSTLTNASRVGQSLTRELPGQRKNLGVLFGSICWQKFFDSALRAQKPEIGFTLYRPVRKKGEPRFIVAQSGSPSPSAETSRDSLQAIYQSRFYGRRLYFEFKPLPAFAEHSERQWPALIGGLGIALSLGVASLVFIQARARLIEVATGQELRASRDQLQHLLYDRERISRDLHDGTIQSIYAVGLGIKRSQKLIDRDPSVAHTQLSESIGELDVAISELRQFILSLEPELPGGESFTTALNALVQRTCRVTNTRIKMNVDERIGTALSPYLSVHLMNLIREGLSNGVRHASANTITISLQQKASRLRLEIADDGVGFDLDAPSSSGSGHRNMKARVKELSGTLSITSAIGCGTTIVVILPLAPGTDGTSTAHSTS